MAIKKRTVPKKKKPLKKSPHVRRCEKLYNRLQRDGQAFKVFEEIASMYNRSFTVPTQMNSLALDIASRCDMEIKTRQCNWPDHVVYQVSLKYADTDKTANHGIYYPTKYVVKTSPSLGLCVMLCYIELCKNVGRWI